MKIVDKKTYVFENALETSPKIVETKDAFWLVSEDELNDKDQIYDSMFERYINPVYWGEAQNDTNYSWAKGKNIKPTGNSNSHLKKVFANKTGKPCWWARTVANYNSSWYKDSVNLIYSNGVSYGSYDSPNSSFGIVPCFCL